MYAVGLVLSPTENPEPMIALNKHTFFLILDQQEVSKDEDFLHEIRLSYT